MEIIVEINWTASTIEQDIMIDAYGRRYAEVAWLTKGKYSRASVSARVMGTTNFEKRWDDQSEGIIATAKQWCEKILRQEFTTVQQPKKRK